MAIQPKRSRFFGEDIYYPESDGKPMADNTIQAEWIINLYNNLHILFKDVKMIFIAADHFWYPVEGKPEIRKAPDIMVAFDRPKAHRRSYRQWKEEGIPPHVVVEIMSPSNSYTEMQVKREFYEQYGVEEFVIIDPDTDSFTIYERSNEELKQVNIRGNQWISPRLGIQLLRTSDGVKALYPDGTPFKTAEEMSEESNFYQQEMKRQKEELEQQKQKTESERQAKEAALSEIERLKAELKRLKGGES